jgi:hypothetical protein
MTHYLRPGYFAYEVTGFTNTLRLVVERARGEWTFTPGLDGGVAVRWSYHFTAKPGRGALVHLLIGPMWKQHMRKGLPRDEQPVRAQRRRRLPAWTPPRPCGRGPGCC